MDLEWVPLIPQYHLLVSLVDRRQRNYPHQDPLCHLRLLFRLLHLLYPPHLFLHYLFLLPLMQVSPRSLMEEFHQSLILVILHQSLFHLFPLKALLQEHLEEDFHPSIQTPAFRKAI